MRRSAEEALAVEDDVARVRAVEASDDVEGRRLARPVRPDQPGDLTLPDVERHVVERDDAPEPARDVPQLEERHLATPLDEVEQPAEDPGAVGAQAVVLVLVRHPRA